MDWPFEEGTPRCIPNPTSTRWHAGQPLTDEDRGAPWLEKVAQWVEECAWTPAKTA